LVPNEQSEGISETTSACHLPVYKHLSKVRSGQSISGSKIFKETSIIYRKSMEIIMFFNVFPIFFPGLSHEKW